MQGKITDVPSGQLLTTVLPSLQTPSTTKTYKIVTGATWDKRTNLLGLNGFIGSVPGLFWGVKKVILAHKRLPKFYCDYTGELGLIGRDMYVFECNTDAEVKQLYDFFQLDFVQKMIGEGFRIRMNFIEKYVFDYLPWILSPESPTDFELNKYIDFIQEEQVSV